MQAKTFACTLHARSSLSVQFIDPWLHSISQETIGKNDPKWPKILFISLCISGTISWLWFMVLMCKMISDFPGGFFWGEGRCKIAKNDPLLPISVCHTLYLRNCISFLVRRWKIMISPGVYLYFKKIIQHCKYQNLCIFYWSTSGCFSSWSVNSKQEFWGVFHLLHICVIFCIYLFL